MELLELYYKRYTGTVKSMDYVEWAKGSLYLDMPEINKLASMYIKEPLNIFEIEKMFDDAIKCIQLVAPSKEQALNNHLKRLHSQLLRPTKETISLVKEMYSCTIEHNLFEEQLKWQEISDAIDEYQYGDNQNGYTEDKINEMIVTHARKTWHTKISKITFKEFIGQKITAVDTEVHLMIQLEKGAIIIECPWRIRNVDEILVGETDIQANHKEKKIICELLIGKTIEDVQLLEQCPLLIVQCEDYFLDLFHASAFFDGWTLTDDEDFYMFSMHGGSIA